MKPFEPGTRLRWRRAPSAHRLPAAVAGWLLESSSLTRRLQRRCGAAFNVRVLASGYGRALPEEARALGVPPHRRCLVREVELRCGATAWVYARTLIPVTTLAGRRRRLAHLGNRPLGALLFADPATRRGRLEVALLTPGQRLHAASGADGPLWGRRSLFLLGARPLLVSEFFLPALVGSGNGR